MPYFYKCNIVLDDGYTKYNITEFIVSKETLSKERIKAELYKRKPYLDYDTVIDELQVIPLVFMKNVTVLGRDC